MDKTLVIFLTDGDTLFFEAVRDFYEDDLNLTFHYFGKSTETKRKAKFDKTKILGYAISADEKEQQAETRAELEKRVSPIAAASLTTGLINPSASIRNSIR